MPHEAMFLRDTPKWRTHGCRKCLEWYYPL